MSPSTTTSLGQEVNALLNTRALGRPLYFRKRVSSTNSLALEAAQRGAGHGTVFVSDYQTHGRGRQGRTWTADEGLNLMFSVILDIPVSEKTTGMVQVAACLGVADAIAGAAAPNKPQFKWPNDILLNGRKLCGMLLQTVSTSTTKFILGIGINVNQTVFPEKLEQHATSLLLSTGQPVDRASLMGSVLLNLEKKLDLMQEAPSTIRKLYTENLVWIGQICTVTGMNHEAEGTLLGIADSGALLLNTSDGTRTIYAGNVSLRVADR